MDELGLDLAGDDGVVSVRRVTEADRRELGLLCGSAESALARWFDPGAEVLSVARCGAVVDDLLRAFDGPYGLTAVVEEIGSTELVGLVGLQERPCRAAEMTYWVARPRRGHGIATRAARLLSGIALTDSSFDVARVEAIVEPTSRIRQPEQAIRANLRPLRCNLRPRSGTFHPVHWVERPRTGSNVEPRPVEITDGIMRVRRSSP